MAATKHSVEFNRAGIKSLINPVDEDVLVKDTSMHTYFETISDADNAFPAVLAKMAEDEMSCNITDQMKALSISIQIFDNGGMLTANMKTRFFLVYESYVSKNCPK